MADTDRPYDKPYNEAAGAELRTRDMESHGFLKEQNRIAGRSHLISEELSLDNIEDAMRYQPWSSDQLQAGEQVREALVMAAKVILRNVPRSPRRTLALQHLISARMDANAAISFNGRF